MNESDKNPNSSNQEILINFLAGVEKIITDNNDLLLDLFTLMKDLKIKIEDLKIKIDNLGYKDESLLRKKVNGWLKNTKK